ncbi:MAG: enoyl-CoA hydratase/isomerase family protein [Planctomycetes bacterium]|nr:enoyl-CoA hydratase/isomerase family protein [Planctomycetota bacterium]
MSETSSPVRTELLEGGSLLCVTLARPKANIIDTEMIQALGAAVNAAAREPALRAVLFQGEGRHFSFGASVDEHRPERVGRMLPAFHRLFRDLADTNRVLLAAVNGLCLGGGMELAVFCHRVFASPDAQFGNPEIKLGVFAPMASLVLPHRCRQGAVDDILLSGRNLKADEALALGVVDEIAQDPAQAALEWHGKHLLPLSAAALRHASRAARLKLLQDLDEVLPRLERLYLEELMSTHDAAEGIAAFIEKRAPAWRHE